MSLHAVNVSGGCCRHGHTYLCVHIHSYMHKHTHVLLLRRGPASAEVSSISLPGTAAPLRLSGPEAKGYGWGPVGSAQGLDLCGRRGTIAWLRSQVSEEQGSGHSSKSTQPVVVQLRSGVVGGYHGLMLRLDTLAEQRRELSYSLC